MKTLKAYIDWSCPHCGNSEQSNDPRPHTVMHVCSGMHGLTTPMVRDGEDAKIVVHEREDYLNGDIQTSDDRGKAISSISKERADGSNDLWVQAPLATIGIGSQ